MPALDQRDAQAELCGYRGDGQAGGAGADHGQVVVGVAAPPRAPGDRQQGDAASPISGPNTWGVKITPRLGRPPSVSTWPMPAPIEA